MADSESDPEPPAEAPPGPIQATPTGCSAVASEIQKYSGWDHSIMLAIAKAENTTCDPQRHNETSSETHATCVGSYGVLQVGCVHYLDYGYSLTAANKNNFALNVEIAYKVWQKQGYNAWTQYKNGEYLKFL